MGSTPGVFPVSNGSNDLTTSLNSTDRIYSGVGKIDYHLNDKNSLSGMFFMSPGAERSWTTLVTKSWRIKRRLNMRVRLSGPWAGHTFRTQTG